MTISDAANIHDTAACEVMSRAKELHPGIGNFSGDTGYRGASARYADGELGVTLHISEKIKDGFAVLSRHRLAKDFEVLAALPPKTLSASPGSQ